MRKLAVLLVLLLAPDGCIRADRPIGVPFSEKRLFEVEVEKYRKLPPEKSMAFAGDRMGVYAAGYAYDLPTREIAIREALRYCRMRRDDLGVEGECRTYAIGDEIVEN